ncbi:RNA polymerase Rpb1, domain 5 family protein, partial [Chlamydia psittaci 01DC11]
IVDTKTGQIIVDLKERIIGRYTNKPIYKKVKSVNEDGSTTKEIAGRNTLITEKIAQEIIDEGYEEVEIRSILG